MKKILSASILILLLYTYIHNPYLTIIGGRGVIKLLYPVALFFILSNLSIFRDVLKHYKKVILLIITLVLFSIIRWILGGDIVEIYTHFVLFIECVLLPCTLASYWIKRGYSVEYFIKLLLIVSAVASVITTLCIVVPSFGSYVRFQLLNTPKDSVLAEVLFRGFGISSELTSGYGYIQGLCFVLGLRYLADNKWYALFMPLVALSVVVNARTGIIIIAIGIVLHFLTVKRVSKILPTLFILVGLVYIGINSLDKIGLSEDSVRFVQMFFEEMNSVGESKDLSDSATTNGLFNNMIVYPRDIFEWIIGRGYNIFSDKVQNSDIGYIIQLNYGGILYMAIWGMLIIRLFKGLRFYSFDRFIPYFLIMAILILNVKGNTLSNGSTFRFFMLIYFVITYPKWKRSIGVF